MLRRILKIIALPLAVLGVFALLYAVWVVLDLPPERPSSRSPSPISTATAPRWFWHAPTSKACC